MEVLGRRRAPVRHLPWRSETEDVQNLLVYERGGGAWVGAAHASRPAGRPRLRSALACDTRRATSHRPRPRDLPCRRRFRSGPGWRPGCGWRPGDSSIRTSRETIRTPDTPRVARQRSSGGGMDPLMISRGRRVSGRRCLTVAPSETAIAAELAPSRGAGSRRDRPGRARSAGRAGARCVRHRCRRRVTRSHRGSASTMAALRSVCRSHLLSIERIDVGPQHPRAPPPVHPPQARRRRHQLGAERRRAPAAAAVRRI